MENDPYNFDAEPRFARFLLRLGIIAVFVLIFYVGLDWALQRVEAAASGPLMVGMLVAVLLLYALLLAIPYMPGIEIGISLLILKGADAAPFVYAATVLGLGIAFLAGRYMPYRWMHNIFADLRLKSACHLLERLAPLGRKERLALLMSRLPKWAKVLFGRARYLLLAGLINMPGNVILGGGGGLAFAAGFSRLFHSGWALLVIALAVLPVPLSVWWFGSVYFPGK